MAAHIGAYFQFGRLNNQMKLALSWTRVVYVPLFYKAFANLELQKLTLCC